MLREMDALVAFPCLLPVQVLGQKTIYDGYLPANGEEYRIRVSSPGEGNPSGGDNLEGLQLECEWQLHCLLSDHRDTLKQRLKHCKDLMSYLKEVKSVVECLTEQKQVSTGSVAHSRKIVEEMETVGWDKLASVDASFQNVTLQCKDEAQRRHKLIVRFNTQETVAPQCVSDLPGKFTCHWSAKGHLSDLVKQFEATLSQYQAFWDALAAVDQKTWVLEPDTASYSACSRRIALSPGTSIQITVDPKHPNTMPECRFLGADQVINPLKDKLNSKLHLWDNTSSIVSNLETLLDVAFPSPIDSKKEDFSLECGICYSYRLGDEIPDKVCDNAHCAQPFHNCCLYEWMRSLPSCQQSFNTIFGECPFCTQPITIKLPTK